MNMFRGMNWSKKALSFSTSSTTRGFSFVELIVTAAIMATVFGGLFSAYETIVEMIAESRIKSNALALVSERMEYVRSLPYSSVGTISGVPSGLLPQTSSTTLNGIAYTERILVSYIDDDADGLAGLDTNAVTTDYKLVKIEYSWQNQEGETRSVFHTTNIVPQGIETTAGGGTIRVNVFDANSLPVSGAEVRFVNSSSSINTPRYTGATGEAYLSGAPAGSGYEIFVTKVGYSSDSTYVATTSNPNPLTLPITVAENSVSTMNFQIDELASLTILTAEPVVEGSFEDQFTDSSLIGTTTNAIVSGGALELAGAPGSYPALGSAISVFTSPSPLKSWTEIDSVVNLPASTNVRIFVYHDSVTPTLVPDSDLPGNSLGFTTNPIDLSELDPGVYPELAVMAVLETSDSMVTPRVTEWELSYVSEQIAIPSVPVRVTSDRTIGADASFQPIAKYSQLLTSDGSGEIELPTMEWGLYTIVEESGTYIASEICPNAPYTLAPDVADELIISLVPTRSDTLRVSVVGNDGVPIPDATVTVEEGMFSDALSTGNCGQVLLDTPGPSVGYTVTAEKTGYSDTVMTGVEVTAAGSSINLVLIP